MAVLRVVPTVLSCVVLAAHFLRSSLLVPFLLALIAPFLLAFPGRLPVRALQVLLLLGAAEWVRTAVVLAADRVAIGIPFGRMLVILGAVALFTALSAWPLGGLRRHAGPVASTG